MNQIAILKYKYFFGNKQCEWVNDQDIFLCPVRCLQPGFKLRDKRIQRDINSFQRFSSNNI